MKTEQKSFFTEYAADSLKRFSELIKAGNVIEKEYRSSYEKTLKDLYVDVRTEAFEVYYQHPEIRKAADAVVLFEKSLDKIQKEKNKQELKKLNNLYAKA